MIWGVGTDLLTAAHRRGEGQALGCSTFLHGCRGVGLQMQPQLSSQPEALRGVWPDKKHKDEVSCGDGALELLEMSLPRKSQSSPRVSASLSAVPLFLCASDPQIPEGTRCYLGLHST